MKKKLFEPSPYSLVYEIFPRLVKRAYQDKGIWKKVRSTHSSESKDYFILHHLYQIVLLINLASLHGNKIQWYLFYFISVSLSISNFLFLFCYFFNSSLGWQGFISSFCSRILSRIQSASKDIWICVHMERFVKSNAFHHVCLLDLVWVMVYKKWIAKGIYGNYSF